jgi:hypothetical protein
MGHWYKSAKSNSRSYAKTSSRGSKRATSSKVSKRYKKGNAPASRGNSYRKGRRSYYKGNRSKGLNKYPKKSSGPEMTAKLVKQALEDLSWMKSDVTRRVVADEISMDQYDKLVFIPIIANFFPSARNPSHFVPPFGNGHIRNVSYTGVAETLDFELSSSSGWVHHSVVFSLKDRAAKRAFQTDAYKAWSINSNLHKAEGSRPTPFMAPASTGLLDVLWPHLPDASTQCVYQKVSKDNVEVWHEEITRHKPEGDGFMTVPYHSWSRIEKTARVTSTGLIAHEDPPRGEISDIVVLHVFKCLDDEMTLRVVNGETKVYCKGTDRGDLVK